MKFKVTIAILTAAICVFIITAPVSAYVMPMIGGGQTSATMIMPEIYFDGHSLSVLDEYGYPFPTYNWNQAPVLRPLIPPAAFNPAMSWAVLTGTAYNYQYGWDSALLDIYTYPFPPGSAIWLKVLNQSPDLETYYQDNGYAPLFGTLDSLGNPSPTIWKWNLQMCHNVYAIPQEVYGRFFAIYKVYLGNSATGAELVNGSGVPLYGSTLVTFRWYRPCPYVLQNDGNDDCTVDFIDYATFAAGWTGTGWNNLATLASHWLVDCTQSPLNASCVPR